MKCLSLCTTGTFLVFMTLFHVFHMTDAREGGQGWNAPDKNHTTVTLFGASGCSGPGTAVGTRGAVSDIVYLCANADEVSVVDRRRLFEWQPLPSHDLILSRELCSMPVFPSSSQQRNGQSQKGIDPLRPSRVLVVSLETHPERWRYAERQMTDFFGPEVPIERFPAVNGYDKSIQPWLLEQADVHSRYHVQVTVEDRCVFERVHAESEDAAKKTPVALISLADAGATTTRSTQSSSLRAHCHTGQRGRNSSKRQSGASTLLLPRTTQHRTLLEGPRWRK